MEAPKRGIFVEKMKKNQKGPVHIVLAYPIILVCTLCKHLKKICLSKSFHVHDSFPRRAPRKTKRSESS